MAHATGISLLVLAAFLSSVYRLVIKLSGDRLSLIASLNLISVLVGLVGIWFVPLPSLTSFKYLLGASTAYVLAMIFLIRGYQHADFGRITPLQGAIRVLGIALLMVWIFDEQATQEHWIAAGLVVVAYVVQGELKDVFNKDHLFTLILAIAVGAFSAIQYTADIGGVRASGTPWSYIVWNFFIGLPLVIYGVFINPAQMMEQLRVQKRAIFAASFLDMASYGIILLVVYFLAMIDILPVINLHIFFAALLGAIFLREGLALRRIVAGVILLSATFVVEFG